MRRLIGRLVDLAIDWIVFCTIFNTAVHILLYLTK